MGKIRVAFFLDVMLEDFDGVSNTIHQIVRRIPKEEIEPIFITPQPPQAKFDFPVFECPYFMLPFSKKAYRVALPGKMKNLNSILDSFQPHLIHFSTPSALGAFAAKYADKHRLPVVTIYHTHFPSTLGLSLGNFSIVNKALNPLYMSIYKMYRKVDKILAPTQSMKDYLSSIQMKPAQLQVWGRGVSTERFGPHHRNETLWPQISVGQKKVLFVSRLVKEKGPKTLIGLYKMLAEKRPDIRMIVTGDGPTRKMLEKNMPEAVFTGKLTGSDLSAAYASADIFVFPSASETFGNVVLEALASGLPVVSANEGGPRDIVKDGITGRLVNPEDVQAYYDEIVRLVDEPALYHKMRTAALDYAQTQDWESLCGELFNLYKSLVAERGATIPS